jgi:hypothetical protein
MTEVVTQKRKIPSLVEVGTQMQKILKNKYKPFTCIGGGSKAKNPQE